MNIFRYHMQETTDKFGWVWGGGGGGVGGVESFNLNKKYIELNLDQKCVFV